MQTSRLDKRHMTIPKQPTYSKLMATDIPIVCGKDLRAIRRKSGLSQYDLSKRSGYHEKTIQYTERGVPIGTDPRLRTFLDMVEACGYKLVAVPINGKKIAQ